jgi:hypothetical protein
MLLRRRRRRRRRQASRRWPRRRLPPRGMKRLSANAQRAALEAAEAETKRAAAQEKAEAFDAAVPAVPYKWMQQKVEAADSYSIRRPQTCFMNDGAFTVFIDRTFPALSPSLRGS